ncbi:unnamed protein product [Cladocopium goreaui]|uniref:Uncharacterized protein n=1 Tax=Cladocopium goreaui TaxID=2562237 RepID=A0A9P1GAB8_9DINO|nr:unnamed protein product [Cladocopium goreaui]
MCGHSGFPSDSDGESVAETTADTTDDGANAASPEKRLEEAVVPHSAADRSTSGVAEANRFQKDDQLVAGAKTQSVKRALPEGSCQLEGQRDAMKRLKSSFQLE